MAVFVGITAIVASLVFVGLQESAAVRNISAVELMADNIDIWRRGCVGEELTPAEQALVSNIH